MKKFLILNNDLRIEKRTEQILIKIEILQNNIKTFINHYKPYFRIQKIKHFIKYEISQRCENIFYLTSQNVYPHPVSKDP